MHYDRHLLKFEDMLVEVVLQVLIGVVDAELLKAVLVEILESKDVQNADRVTLHHTSGQRHLHRL